MRQLASEMQRFVVFREREFFLFQHFFAVGYDRDKLIDEPTCAMARNHIVLCLGSLDGMVSNPLAISRFGNDLLYASVVSGISGRAWNPAKCSLL
jgi:hypothetical protein